MPSPSFAAVDLGAESGRVILGNLKDEKLSIQEIHRFPNGGVRVGNSLYWDVLRLWDEIQVGLAKAGSHSENTLRSIGLDTWGVDYGLLDALAWYIERYEERTGIKVNFNHNGIDMELPSTTKTVIYRIVQEALTNIRKYAKATTIDVSI